MNRIKELRKKKGVTQKQVADDTGISFVTLSRYETGKRELSDKRVREVLAGYFDVPVSYVMGIYEEKDDMISIPIAEYERLKEAEEQLNSIKEVLGGKI